MNNIKHYSMSKVRSMFKNYFHFHENNLRLDLDMLKTDYEKNTISNSHPNYIDLKNSLRPDMCNYSLLVNCCEGNYHLTETSLRNYIFLYVFADDTDTITLDICN